MRDLTSYIQCFENILSKDLCREIIDTFKLEKWNRATVSDSKISDMRKCYNLKLDDKFTKEIYNAIGKILIKYSEKFPLFSTGLTIEDTGYTHLVYLGQEKGEYKIHVDHFDLHPRVLSCSLILNDDYEGGDFCFPHAVLPVSKGNRHAIITWIH